MRADLAGLLAYFGPLYLRKAARRLKQLKLDPTTRQRATAHIQATIQAEGPRTRPELAAALAAEGIPVAGQAIAHLVRGAALEGVICFGPDRDGVQTYVVLDDWLERGAAPDPADTLARLARRYVSGYGPVTPSDLAAWAGIMQQEARTSFEAIEDELSEVTLEGAPAWLLADHTVWIDADPPAGPDVRLLPGYDPYWLGYRARGFMVAEAQRIHPGGGLIRPVLLVDGSAAGTWRLQRGKRATTLHVTPFAALDEAVRAALENEVQAVGRFLETPVTLALDEPV